MFRFSSDEMEEEEEEAAEEEEEEEPGLTNFVIPSPDLVSSDDGKEGEEQDPSPFFLGKTKKGRNLPRLKNRRAVQDTQKHGQMYANKSLITASFTGPRIPLSHLLPLPPLQPFPPLPLCLQVA